MLCGGVQYKYLQDCGEAKAVQRCAVQGRFSLLFLVLQLRWRFKLFKFEATVRFEK